MRRKRHKPGGTPSQLHKPSGLIVELLKLSNALSRDQIRAVISDIYSPNHLIGWNRGVNGADDLANKCGQVIQKVIPCLDFATGKALAPKKECCDAISSIKQTNPECLCYIIQQTHKGSPESKSMNIQEDKLLQLPSVCNVKNASITNCPKLLGLSPSSPDAAIFTNATKVNPPASSTTAQPTTATPSKSGSQMLTPGMVLLALITVLAFISDGGIGFGVE